MTGSERTGAGKPEDLARLFNERANAGDVEGLVALYEADAVLAVGAVVASGHAEIRQFYTRLLGRKSAFAQPETLPAVVNGQLALTFARLPDGTLSVEVARCQEDGAWRWAIDQLKVAAPARTDAG